jgi:hypothetical protein
MVRYASFGAFAIKLSSDLGRLHAILIILVWEDVDRIIAESATRQLHQECEVTAKAWSVPGSLIAQASSDRAP